MNINDYKRLVNKYTPSEDKLKDALLAFVSGGVIGLFSTIIYELLLKNNISNNIACTITLVLLIIISSILTGIGIFDKLVEKFKCGIIVPITGFAHSMTSAALDAKKDGLITGIGASTFKLAGSVIVYGVVSAFILTMIKVIFNG